MTREQYLIIRESGQITHEQIYELAWEYYEKTNPWEEIKKYKTKEEFLPAFIEVMQLANVNFSVIFNFFDIEFGLTKIIDLKTNNIIKIL